MKPPEEIPSPYRTVGPIARYFKACLQMLIGVAAVVAIAIWLSREARHGATLKQLSDDLFVSIGFALGAAAVLELAYTLFTHGADEALDPLMLGVSAALLVQLGHVQEFDPRQGLAALAYVAALAGLFATRRFLAELGEPESSNVPSRWLHHFRIWLQRHLQSRLRTLRTGRQARESTVSQSQETGASDSDP